MKCALPAIELRGMAVSTPEARIQEHDWAIELAGIMKPRPTSVVVDLVSALPDFIGISGSLPSHLRPSMRKSSGIRS
jgi:hypothetical protein